jgi:hypothetical protein
MIQRRAYVADSDHVAAALEMYADGSGATA